MDWSTRSSIWLYSCKCEVWEVANLRTAPYHPKLNGTVERGIKNLRVEVRAMLLGGDDEEVPKFRASCGPSVNYQTPLQVNPPIF